MMVKYLFSSQRTFVQPSTPCNTSCSTSQSGTTGSLWPYDAGPNGLDPGFHTSSLPVTLQCWTWWTGPRVSHIQFPSSSPRLCRGSRHQGHGQSAGEEWWASDMIPDWKCWLDSPHQCLSGWTTDTWTQFPNKHHALKHSPVAVVTNNGYLLSTNSDKRPHRRLMLRCRGRRCWQYERTSEEWKERILSITQLQRHWEVLPNQSES